MQYGANYYKKMAVLRYKDYMLELHRNGKSVREITKLVNSRIKKTKLKNYTISYGTVYNLIKKQG